jgi:uncharacterized membrane protein
MRNPRIAAFRTVAVIVAIAGVLAGTAAGPWTPPAAAQVFQVAAQSTPAPSNPGAPGTPGYGPGNPGYGPRFGPGSRPGFGPGRGFYGRGRRPAIAAAFVLFALLRFLLLIALLVIAWRVITSRSLWGRPDAAVQAVRERFARGEISEDEYRKRLAVLS